MKRFLFLCALCAAISAAVIAQQQQKSAQPPPVAPASPAANAASTATATSPAHQAVGGTSAAVQNAALDPYRNYMLRVNQNGKYVGGFNSISFVSGPRPGPDSRSPGHATENVTLKSGVTHDPEFASWLSSVGAGRGRDIVIDAFNKAGQKITSYDFKHCFLTSVHTAPALDAGAHATMLETVVLRCDETRR